MFTGLVQAVGRLQRRSSGLVVSGCEPFAPLTIGDSVAVDGVCLTVAHCSDDGSRFVLAVIPHTWQATTLQSLSIGDLVNLEADQLARYAERLLQADHAESGQAHGDLSKPWLIEDGWA